MLQVACTMPSHHLENTLNLCFFECEGGRENGEGCERHPPTHQDKRICSGIQLSPPSCLAFSIEFRRQKA